MALRITEAEARRAGQTEAGFTRTVIAYAQLRGWLAMHQRPARTKKGWATAVMGDVGFPDLILVRTRPPGDRRCVVAELKMPGRKPTLEQELWLLSFAVIQGIEVYTWRPTDWPKIERTLA